MPVFNTKKCPYCNTQPLKVLMCINKASEGIFDEKEEGMLSEVGTNTEEIVGLECCSHQQEIPLNALRDWE